MRNNGSLTGIPLLGRHRGRAVQGAAPEWIFNSPLLQKRSQSMAFPPCAAKAAYCSPSSLWLSCFGYHYMTF